MQYAILAKNADIDNLPFRPTFAVGFYRAGEEEAFHAFCQALKTRFEDLEILGCSSESTIYGTSSSHEISQDRSFGLLCLDMAKDACSITYEAEISAVDTNRPSRKAVVLFASLYHKKLEAMIAKLQSDKARPVFGAIAASAGDDTAPSIYHDGTFYPQGLLAWEIDTSSYEVGGFSLYDFDPVGFELEITEAEKSTIIEIENKPALDMIEDMIGPLTQESITSYDHPFFLRRKNRELAAAGIPLASIYAVDRKRRSITLHREVSVGDKLRLAVPFSREKQEHTLNAFRRYRDKNGIALLFVCVAYKGHWDDMEPIYLTHIARSLKQPFLGFHTFGEIGPLGKNAPAILHNQTLTLLNITEKAQ